MASPERRSKRLRPRLRDNARLLRSAYEALADDVHRGQFITPPAEWLLDHFHVVQAEIRAIRQNLPNRYYRELPTLFERQYAGHARVYAMALELLRHSDSRLEQAQLVRFMNSYQSVAPLTIGELWAWPSILKVALIENLRRLAEELLIARDSRIAADAVIADVRNSPAAVGPAAIVGHGVRRPAAAARPRIRAAPVAAARHDRRASARARPDRRRRHPRRTSAAGRRAGVDRQRADQPAAVLDAQLERLLRVGQPRRTGAAARPVGHVRRDGLPEPRPPAPGRRRAGGADRRSADARGAARHRERQAVRRSRRR